MSTRIPEIGAREGLTLEFKRAEKLRKPDPRRDLVRTVVAMRNARGGSIWIGFTEDEGGMTGLDPLGPQDRQHVDSLRNQLIDLIEPMVEIGRDVRFEPVDVPGGWVLEIVVDGDVGAQPCCLLRRLCREFLKRSGSRNALLPYSTVVGRRDSSAPSIREAVEQLHRNWCNTFAAFPGLAFTAAPDPHRHRDATPRSVSEEALDLLRSPPRDSIRSDGWTWFSKHDPATRLSSGGRVGTGRKDEPYRFLELQPNGTLQFFTTMEHLGWKTRHPQHVEFELPPKGEVYPYAVIETAASLLRTYAILLSLEEYGSLETVGLQLSFVHAAGWVMCRRGPDSVLFGDMRQDWFQVTEDPAETPVLLQTAEAIRKSPDLVSFNLLTDLLQTDGGEQSTLPWYEGAPDAPRFIPPQ